MDKVELGCFSLMVLTDGGIAQDEVYFVTTDKMLAELFSKLSKILWKKTPIRIRYRRGKHSWMKLKIKSSKIADTLAKLTKNKSSIPEFVMEEKDPKILTEYLRVIVSTDGGVVFYQNKRSDGYIRTERHIIIGSKNEPIKNQLRELFSRLGINTRTVKEGLRISGRDNLQKFRDKVRFISGCRVTRKSHKWRGYTKNHVLNLMLASYSGSTAPRNSVP